MSCFVFFFVVYLYTGPKLRFYYYFISLQLGVVPCVGRKKSPRTHL